MDRRAVIGIGRAFAGALLFALPMLMTMEMWWIGFHIHPLKLVLLIVVTVPLLTGFSRIAGFEPTRTIADDLVDAFVAIAIAALMAVTVLFAFRVVSFDMPPQEIVGKIALQTFPGGIGAVLARGQLGAASEEPQQGRRRGYGAILLVMAAGALFLGLNVAPTEEMVLLSYMMSPWREIALAVLSILLMHAFVYSLSFRGRPEAAPGTTFWMLLLRYTIVGYALVLLISLYLLWTFGRTEGTGLEAILSACIVLGFPCAIGAAASRLVV